jgi:transposase-like protein
MTDPMLDRQVRRRLAILRHADEMTGNVAMTCRYFGISRQVFYTWRRRYDELGADGLRDRSRRPRVSPNATHVEVVGKIIYLRQNYHFGPAKIAMYLKRYMRRGHPLGDPCPRPAVLSTSTGRRPCPVACAVHSLLIASIR